MGSTDCDLLHNLLRRLRHIFAFFRNGLISFNTFSVLATSTASGDPLNSVFIPFFKRSSFSHSYRTHSRFENDAGDGSSVDNRLHHGVDDVVEIPREHRGNAWNATGLPGVQGNGHR